MTSAQKEPLPFLIPEYCKGCARCIEACTKGCITVGTEINPTTGLIPVVLNLEDCTSCKLCTVACPEPFGLRMEEDYHEDPVGFFGEVKKGVPAPEDIPDTELELPTINPMILKGTYASAIGAVLAGCRHVYGYPITPSTEGAELMAKVLPHLDGVFYQAPSETATINILYGTAGAGLRCMTFTSSPGLSLMLEGMSYLIGAELPTVIVNIMRGGPGLGNIAPEQSDIKLVCRGLGHGNTHALILAPSTPQEMLDLTILSFELAFKYRNPVMILGDGYLGQMTGKVILPKKMIKPGLPKWAVWGDKEHSRNVNSSIHLSEQELSKHNVHLNQKYKTIIENEQRSECFECEDADYIIVACNTPSQMALGATQHLRAKGYKVGLFRPITLWPFPIKEFSRVLGEGRLSENSQPSPKAIIVVEASNGQLEDELRLNLSYKSKGPLPTIENVRTFGGILPQMQEIIEKIENLDKKMRIEKN